MFNAVLRNYVESLEQRIFQEDEHAWTVDDYELTVSRNRVVCSCGYYQKCGLPCTHLIKTIVMIREDIQNYIHPRWLVS